jgi:hypothetical protein
MESGEGATHKEEIGLLTREEAIRLLDDGEEHKFLVEVGSEEPVFVVAPSLDQLQREEPTAHPRLHVQIREGLQAVGAVKDSENVLGGYCRVDSGELLWGGPSTHPVNAATAEQFDLAVDGRRIRLIDQWIGQNPPGKTGIPPRHVK